MKISEKIEFGDFQTPLALAEEVCRALLRLGVRADTVVEPTCGLGSFLVAAAEAFKPRQLLGFEINPAYLAKATSDLESAGATARLQQADFFSHDWDRELSGIEGDLLLIGNPPWVTNSTVSGISGTNLPEKSNFQGLRGIAAMTGKSNFDISEWMLIRLVNALRGRRATVAFLLKSSAARKALRHLWLNDGRVASASLFGIDSKKHFNVAVDTSLLLLTTGANGFPEAAVFKDLTTNRPSHRMGLIGKELVADLDSFERLRHLTGLSPYQWRSGVKHDCSPVMELAQTTPGSFANKLGETFRLEDDYVFPLLKCSDLANNRLETDRFVIVTQTKVGADTAAIRRRAPLTWAYLESHREALNARKSSIYRNQVPFALFGVGDYSFAPWKVAVSALHAHLRFRVVGTKQGRPMFFDDTCYFLPFATEEEASVVAAILNSAPCLEFLQSLIFTGSKRPITVDLLHRLDLAAIAQAAGLSAEWNRHQRTRYTAPDAIPQMELLMDRPNP